jgi:hypothetical protein
MDTAVDSGSMGEQDAPIIIRVIFKRSPMLAELRAASYESDDTHLRAKDGNGKTIADFLLDEVAGWWVQPLRSRDEKHGEIPYASCKRAIDAVLAVLEEVGRPLTQAEITNKVLAGGFRGAPAGTETKINRSIKSFLKGSGKAKSRIKQIGELIGLTEWDNSRFKARNTLAIVGE